MSPEKNKEYEELRKFLGSLQGKVLFEWKQNKRIYGLSIVGFMISMIFMLLFNTTNNPMLSMIYFIHFLLLFIYTIAIKKSNIKNFPSAQKKLKEIEDKHNELFIDSFIKYLESKLTPYEWCDYFPLPSNSPIMFNLFFSGVFTLFISFYNLWADEKFQGVSQIYISLWVIVIYALAQLCKNFYSLKKPNDFETTLRALRVVKKYKTRNYGIKG
jgi:magnesium-transporting ATPase (P-type)